MYAGNAMRSHDITDLIPPNPIIISSAIRTKLRSKWCYYHIWSSSFPEYNWWHGTGMLQFHRLCITIKNHIVASANKERDDQMSVQW